MAVDPNQQFIDQLKSIAAAKPLPTAPMATTASTTLSKAQLGFNDYRLNSIASAPTLRNRIQEIAAGKPQLNTVQKVFTNPIVQNALKPLTVLDTGRRATISAVRELADAMDSNPETRAKFGDFIQQAKDPAYGFGTAFPISGWKGRIIGLVGDIALDPITYLSLGSNIPGEIALEGGRVISGKLAREAVAGGASRIVGRSSREALARFVEKRMLASNLVEGGVKYADNEIARVMADVAARGVRAVPQEIAMQTGLRSAKPSFYLFGGQVKIAGSGPIADLIERGIIKGRMGFVNTRIGGKIQEAFTPMGIDAVGQIDPKVIRQARVDLARGKAVDSRRSLQLLAGEEERRIAFNVALDVANKKLDPLFVHPEMENFGKTVHELLEMPTAERLNGASTGERKLAADIKDTLTKMHEEIDATMKAIDPNYKLGKIEEYFPHMLSDQGIKHIRDTSNPWVADILKFMSIDITNPASSFRSRNIRAGIEDFFGVALKEEDITVSRLNAIAKKKLGFDLFETDAKKVLAKYGTHYSEQMGSAAFMQHLLRNPDLMDYIKTEISYDPEVMQKFVTTVSERLNSVQVSNAEISNLLDTSLENIDNIIKQATEAGTKELDTVSKNLVTDEILSANEQKIAQLHSELVQALGKAYEARYLAYGELGMAQDVVEQIESKFQSISERLNALPGDLLESFNSGKINEISRPYVAGLTEGIQPVDRLNAMTGIDRIERIKQVRKEVELLRNELRTIAESYSVAKAFGNDIGDFYNALDDAILGQTDVNFPERVLDSFDISEGLRRSIKEKMEALPMAKGRKGGQPNYYLGKTVGEWWGDKAAALNPDAQAIQQLLDPNNVVKKSALERLTLEEVRNRLIRSTTTGDNLVEMQEAVTWLMLRDLKANPELAKDLIANNTDNAIVRRLTELRSLNEEVGRMNDVLQRVAVGLSDDNIVVVDELVTRLNEVNGQINEMIIERANMAGADVMSTLQLEMVKSNYDLAWLGKTGEMSQRDIDEFILDLHNAGETEIANLLDEQYTTGATYEKFQETIKQLTEWRQNESRGLSSVNRAYNVEKYDQLGKNVTELEKTREELQSQIKTAGMKLSGNERNAYNRLQRYGSYQELTRNYSDRALSYYLISETNMHFKRLATAMAPLGTIVDAGVWQRVFHEVARQQVRGAKQFSREFGQVVELLREVQTVVQAGTAGEQWAILREQMTKLLNSENGNSVRKFFPDFDLILNKSGMKDLSRLHAQNPRSQEIITRMQEMLGILDIEAQTGTRSGRAAMETGRESGKNASTPLVEKTIDLTKTAMQEMNVTRVPSVEEQLAKVFSEKKNISIEKLYNQIMNLLDNGAVPDVNRLARTQAGELVGRIDYSPASAFAQGMTPQEQFRKEVISLAQEWADITEALKKQRAVAQEAAKKAGVDIGTRTASRTVRGRVGGGLSYGFAGLFNDAIKPSASRTRVRIFFGELLGGTFEYNAVADPMKFDIATIGREARQAARIKEVPFESSYAGKTLASSQERISNLLNLIDPEINTAQIMGAEIVPGLDRSAGKGGAGVWGPLAYADQAEQLAKELKASIAQDAELMQAATLAGVEAKAVLDGTMTVEQMQSVADNLRKLYELEPTVTTWENAGKRGIALMYADADPSLWQKFPEEVRQMIRDYRGLKADVARLEANPLLPVAEKRQQFFKILQKLSGNDLHKLQNQAGEFVLDPFSRPKEFIWNEARPGAVDAAGNPITSNIDTNLLDRHFQQMGNSTVTLSPTGEAIISGGRNASRAPRGLQHEVYQLDVVNFKEALDARNRGTGSFIFIDENGNTIQLQDAIEKYASGEPFTTLKPIQGGNILSEGIGSKDSIALQNARVNSGHTYDPGKTWVRVPDEKEVSEAASYGTGAVVQPAKPEQYIRLPWGNSVPGYGPSQFAFTHNGRPLSFTEEEFMSLFLPPQKAEEQTIRQLEEQIAKLEEEKFVVPQGKKLVQKAARDKNARIDAKIVEIRTKINAIFEKPVETKNVPQLRAEIKKLEAQLPTTTRGLTNAQKTAAMKVQAQIETRQRQIAVIAARVNGEAKFASLIEQLTPELGKALGLSEKASENPSKIADALAERWQIVHQGDDVAKARTQISRARFNSSEEGKIVKELGEAKAKVSEAQFNEYYKNTRMKLEQAAQYQQAADEARLAYDLNTRTADDIRRINNLLGEVRPLVGDKIPEIGYETATKEQRLAQAQASVERNAQRQLLKEQVAPLIERKTALEKELQTATVGQYLRDETGRVVYTPDGQPRFKKMTQQDAENIISLQNDLAAVDEKIASTTAELDKLTAPVTSRQSTQLSETTIADLPNQLDDMAFNLRHAKLQPIIEANPKLKEALGAIRKEFGEKSPRYRQFEEMLDVLIFEKEQMDALQVAQKTLADIDIKVTKKVQTADELVAKKAESWNKAQILYDENAAQRYWTLQYIDAAQQRLDKLNAISARVRETLIKKKVNPKDMTWVNEVDMITAELSPVLAGMKNMKMEKNMQVIMTKRAEQLIEHQTLLAGLSDAQRNLAYARGLEQMIGRGASKNELVLAARRGNIPAEVLSGVRIDEILKEGWVRLGGPYQNLQVTPEIAEIFQNAHRLIEPDAVRALSNFLGSYTKFFKAYATLSPGFHVRNAISNGMMLFFGGGRGEFLKEGLVVSRAWNEAQQAGKTWEQFLASLPEAQRVHAEVARLSTAASGGGVYSDAFNEIRNGDQWWNTKLNKVSQKFGQFADDHARFIFGYDASMQGFDVGMAAARTKRFFVDYQDVSTVDKALRQVIPFWMWTSRNLPLHIQNMWLNPKPYAIYNSIVRNLRDDKEGDIVPNYFRELGAFKLPFGKDLYANPDLGFNRIGATLNEFSDPARLMSNVNPAIRVPIELMGNRQLYSNRPFSSTPVQVEGPLGSALQPLAQILGMGTTNKKGEKFINDKLFYGVRNAIPLAGTVERLVPSTPTYQQRGTANQWLGWAGAPVKQVTEQMKASELTRIKKSLEAFMNEQKAIGNIE
jgi:hypothetical protein